MRHHGVCSCGIGKHSKGILYLLLEEAEENVQCKPYVVVKVYIQCAFATVHKAGQVYTTNVFLIW